jgi:hypothetical protein
VPVGPAHIAAFITRSGRTIQLAGYARLSGRVITKARARPVPGARVTLLDTTGAAGVVAEADETGRYAFDSLADGQYTTLPRLEEVPGACPRSWPRPGAGVVRARAKGDGRRPVATARDVDGVT